MAVTRTPHPPYISKSKYLAGLQCPKLLWYHYNGREQFPEIPPSTQAIFDQGHEVGELAKKLFPNGMNVAPETLQPDEVHLQSFQAITRRIPLFEAGFHYTNAFARADILDPVPGNKWDIIEVKSSTGIKDINIADITFQRFTYENAGVKVRNCRLMYINNKYVRLGEINPGQLFCDEDVTSYVRESLPTIAPHLKKMGRIISSQNCPEVTIGQQCSDPYECPLQEMCHSFLPEHNVFELTRIGQKGYDLLARGVLKIDDIPAGMKLTALQKIQVDAVRTRKAHVQREAIQSFLQTLSYPLYFLDFETFSTAIPLYDNLHPYQRVPFQFSLHVLKTPTSSPKHFSFLADGKSDPREKVISQLKSLLGSTGSVVAYNAAFEKGVLNEVSSVYPQYRTWYKELEPRIVDLLTPFRAFYYYHPEQHGSASIKAVYPVLTGHSYDELPIAEGGTASNEYLRVTFGNVMNAERLKIRRQLEEYCATDTRAMLEIAAKLHSLK